MKIGEIVSWILIVISVVILTGCATSRSIIEVSAPATSPVARAESKEIFINSVIDNRIFEVKPKEPNIPSLDPSEEQGDSIKSRAIGRKRNTYGMGLGDILLPEGQTVVSLVTETLRHAFTENGYRVVNNKNQVSDNTYIVDVNIYKFWSWMNPGFWALTLSTEISTDVALKNNAFETKNTISVKASDTFQTGTEDNYKEVIDKALTSYVSEIKKQKF